MGVMEYLHLLSFICTACQFVLVGLATCWGGQLIMNIINITWGAKIYIFKIFVVSANHIESML